jgi:hypothetical protein
MDHPLAIERNRQALLTIVASLVALLGGRDGAAVISRALRRAALGLLRPAESAVRRLIVIAARGLAVPAPAQRPFPAGLAGQWGARGGEKRTPAFRLFDPPQRFARMVRVAPRGVPRIRTFGGGSPFAPPAPPPAPAAARPDPDSPVESGAIRLRLAALELALADLPRQARRLVRHLARDRERRPFPRQPLRIGRPPGWRRDPARAVDAVLHECHGLALAVQRADTS